MKKIGLIFAVVLLVGCANATNAQKGAGIGALAGAGLGAIIGNQSGHAGEGAAIGAGVGALGGALIGSQQDKRVCPVCGRKFGADVDHCPYDGEALIEPE